MKLEATHLTGNKYVVRPAGQLGTCGFHPEPWEAVYILAGSPEEAVEWVSNPTCGMCDSPLPSPHVGPMCDSCKTIQF